MSGERLVLRRYGSWRSDGRTTTQREFAALRLAVENGVPAPLPMWSDEGGIFDEPAVVISYVDGAPLRLRVV